MILVCLGLKVFSGSGASGTKTWKSPGQIRMVGHSRRRGEKKGEKVVEIIRDPSTTHSIPYSLTEPEFWEHLL